MAQSTSVFTNKPRNMNSQITRRTNLALRTKNYLFIASLMAGMLFFSSSCTKEDAAAADPAEQLASLKVGLVGHWDFTGNANDLSERSNHGAVVGAIPAEDRFGRPNSAYQFNGSGDHINLGNVTELAFGGFETYTMAAWVKPDSAGGNIISKWNGGVLAGWYLQIKADMHVRAYRNVGPWSTASADPVGENAWTHVAAKYDGSHLTIYINGVLQARQEFTSQPHDHRTDLIIGALHSRYELAGFFHGIIDEVRIYDRDLSDVEIETLAEN